MSAGTKTTKGSRPQRRWARRALLAAIALFAFWILTAYLVMPFALRHFEHQRALSDVPMDTRTAQGLPGDPLNVGIVGSRQELVVAMTDAGWLLADPVTLRTGIDIVGSVVLDRPDTQAPVSPLFYQGRQQDLAFEKAVGGSADRRQHVRFWQVLPSGAEGRPVWLGSASFDDGIGFSHYTGAITHAIDPNVDAMRDALSKDLARTRRVLRTYEISGVGPTLNGRNGEGDRYVTDGELRVSVIAPPGQSGVNPPPELANPPLVQFKNTLWRAFAGTGAGTGDYGPD